MQLLGSLFALLALAGLCAALAVFGKLPAGLCPLAALALVLTALTAAGMAGVLAAAVWALYGLGLAGGGLALRRKRQAWAVTQRPVGERPRASVLAGQPAGCQAGGLRGMIRGCACRMSLPGLLFWGGAALLLFYFAWLQPEFMNFDEYSFWGTAARLTSLNGRLYTECEIGIPWQITQTAAIPLASYFAQPFGGFAAWRTIWAVDLLLLAGFAAVAECAAAGGRRLAGPVGLTCLLVPFALVLYSHTAVFCTPYLEAMGDVAAGVLFGGAAAFWLGVRRVRPQLWWLTLPVVCLCANIKDNTFVLGLAAAGIAAADCLLFGRGSSPFTARRLARRAAAALALLAAPLAQYLAWGRYTLALVQANAAAGGAGATSQPLQAVLVQGVRLFLDLPVTEYYEQRRQPALAYAQTLRQWFFNHPVSLLGSGAAVAAVILLLFAGAVLLAPAGREKLRAALCAVCSAACFAAYWLMLLLSYAFILKDSTPENPVSYNRYFQSFYIGWFLLALAVFGDMAARARRGWAARMAALALAAVFAALCALELEPQFTVFGVPAAQYEETRAEAATARWAAAAVPEGETLFLVYQGDDGYHWFEYSCFCLPRIVTYGAGGGTYGLPEHAAGSYYQDYTAEEFYALVDESGARYLLAARSDEIFAASYGALFSDGLAAAENGAALYRVENGGFALEAVQAEVSAP